MPVFLAISSAFGKLSGAARVLMVLAAFLGGLALWQTVKASRLAGARDRAEAALLAERSARAIDTASIATLRGQLAASNEQVAARGREYQESADRFARTIQDLDGRRKASDRALAGLAAELNSEDLANCRTSSSVRRALEGL
jgi:hypothetical protein